MRCSFFLQQVIHVLKVLDMAALVGSNGYALHILLDGAVHDLLYRTIMAQVNDLAAGGLNDTAHDVDSSVMTVEKGGCRYDTYFMLRNVGFQTPDKFSKKV